MGASSLRTLPCSRHSVPASQEWFLEKNTQQEGWAVTVAQLRPHPGAGSVLSGGEVSGSVTVPEARPTAQRQSHGRNMVKIRHLSTWGENVE